MSLGMDKGCEHLSRGRGLCRERGWRGLSSASPARPQQEPLRAHACSARPRALNGSTKERKSELLAEPRASRPALPWMVPGMLLTWRKG